MGVFNALVAVQGDRTHIEYNLALELERLVQPWMPGRFDWYAIGTEALAFSAYLDPHEGWVCAWDTDTDDDDSAFIFGNHDGWSSSMWREQLDKWITDLDKGFVLIPIRCHD
jgi:hypothetical protein